MPWKESKALDERKKFIQDWEREEEPFAELCRRYEITRPTGYLLVARYKAEGELGLVARSRAPQHRPQAMAEDIARQIIDLRQQHPLWGPRKLQVYLAQRYPQKRWPASSSIGDLIRREGLAHPRRRRKRTPLHTDPLQHAQAPNQLWCADFKGWFRCLDGQRCDPLTSTDAFSRFVLRCRAVPKTDGVQTAAVFEAMFREYGLPDAIRTDNGPPFASPAPCGLSRLSMWWLRLGIRHERIRPGHPEENGRHERMHQTLKAATAMPPRANLRQQQKAFLSFEREYNYERPHEALNYRTPAQLYVASARPYPSRLPELAFPPGCDLRRISQQGSLKWKGERSFVSEVLAREPIGLLEVEEEFFEVYYGPLLLGWFDAREPVFVADPGPRRPRPGKAHKPAGVQA